MPTPESYDAMQARLTKAFNLVQPATHWKDQIDAFVPMEALHRDGLTLHDLSEAVIHFTATVPTIKEGRTGFFVKADGYRAGPAGDNACQTVVAIAKVR